MQTASLFDALARQGRLVRKELTEILRDRRTIVTLVLMPILVYPLIGVGFVQFFRAVAPTTDPQYMIGFDDVGARAVFMQVFEAVGPDAKESTAPAGKSPKIDTMVVPSIDQALRDGVIDVGLTLDADRVEGARAEDRPRALMFEATYLSRSASAPATSLWVERLLQRANARLLDHLLRTSDPPPGPRLSLRRNVLASPEGDGMITLSSVIPFILILMTITGAVYPAIDLTAGERERGTLEILVAAPVPRLHLLIAKYAAVVFVAILTAFMNLAAMTVTVYVNPLGQTLLGGVGLTPLLLAQLLALLLLFASFFAAVLLTITSFARSFKEAQAYLIPIMLMSLAPGAIGLVPGLALTPGLAVTPLVNIVLLGRDLIDGNVNLAMTVLAITATFVYAVAALGLAARVFGAEAVLYNEQNSWNDLTRRPATPQAAATPATALWSLALMIPLFFVTEATLKATLPETDWARIAALGVVSVCMFLGVPALFAWHERVVWRTGFGLRPLTWTQGLASLLFGASLWALVLPLIAWIQPPAFDSSNETYEAAVQLFRNRFAALRPALVTVLVVQAIVEELFFRGFLWQALSRRASTVWTLLSISLLFGLAHVVMGGPLGLERLLPSTLLGVILGLIRARTGSVVAAALVHALHNGILAYLGQSELTRGLETLPLPWMLAAGITCGAATLLLVWPIQSRRDDSIST